MQQLILGHAEYNLYFACGSDYRIRRYLTSTKLQALCFAALFITAGQILDAGWLYICLLLLFSLATLLELRGFYRACTRYRRLFDKIMDLQEKIHGKEKYTAAFELANSLAAGHKYKNATLLTRAFLIVVILSALFSGIYAHAVLIIALLAFIWLTLKIKIQYANDIVNWKRLIRENGADLISSGVEICIES